MIDLHSHILPGVDDGVGSLQEAVALARAASRDGISAIAATPHVSYRYPTPAALMETRVEEVAAAVHAAGVPVRVLPGGEVTVESAIAMGPDERRRFGLAGSDSHLLVEFPYHGWPLDLAWLVDDLGRTGVTAVLAHPERSPEVRDDPERLRPLVESGALVQLTASSLDGRAGRVTRATAVTLVRSGLAHLIASDAHAPGVRAVGMRAAARSLRNRRLAAWMTSDVPGAIAAGAPPPPRPRESRRPWRRGR